ncbi:MAG: hypothetical protein HYS38_01460 [Acidobacteria bacterium]|nr:hypothetical protein [Acidobacteriota bacterium]
MNMLSSAQIHRQLWQYLAGSLSIDEFEDWLVSSSWNMHKDADRDAQELVGAIELRLAEYSQGHLDEADLKSELQMIAVHGWKLPVSKMLVFWFDNMPSATAVSSTFREPLPIQAITLAGDLVTSSDTRSAANRTFTRREALQAAS